MSTTKDDKLSVDMALLLARLAFGGSMLMAHGWPKLQNFTLVSEKFPSLFGLSSSTCLGLAVFAEFFCSILLILGLTSRFALSQLIATMAVGVYFHTTVLKQQLFDAPGKPSGELPFIYLMIFIILMILGSGRVSLDAVIKTKRANRPTSKPSSKSSDKKKAPKKK
ncbi:DoxX family protein [Lentisphaera profundi]|uniref:DoxX family protein n=1 Tax=Lentisphaera profundi TaxID=1658616 RepID=A0ABY7VP48_9BACT|nr:DoxX family protein [Lentisphaera profundi]WDE95925.1 DoxX family protein [Lentisphaera profundi]